MFYFHFRHFQQKNKPRHKKTNIKRLFTLSITADIYYSIYVESRHVVWRPYATKHTGLRTCVVNYHVSHIQTQEAGNKHTTFKELFNIYVRGFTNPRD